MAQSILASLPHELTNIFRLIDCLVWIGFYAGLIVVPAVLIGYDNWKRKTERGAR